MAAAPTFKNLYYKRAVATEKPCYICYKPTTAVLATINTVDFFYTCTTHLSDPGFASPVSDGVGDEANKAISSEEIAKVKAEWEEAQKKKAERAKDKAKEKDKDKDGDPAKDDSEKGKNAKEDAEKKPNVPGAFTPPAEKPTTPAHERYILHRNMFALRLDEHRKRRQAKQTKELVPRLPAAPATPLPPPS